MSTDRIFFSFTTIRKRIITKLITLFILSKNWYFTVGHCAKMMGILERALTHHADKLWYVVVDDDTLLR